jgi:hypothetical protein
MPAMTEGGTDPPGVAYVYAPDRTTERPIAHLAGFRGVLQVDGFEASKVLAKRCDVQLAFCWRVAAGRNLRLILNWLRLFVAWKRLEVRVRRATVQCDCLPPDR